MNTNAVVFVGGLLAAACLGLGFAIAFKQELVRRVAAAVEWLLKVSFFDSVRIIIFIKPLRKYARIVGELVWLVLLVIVGRYLIVSRPALASIPGPYIPMIGYVYLLSLLFMLEIGMQLSGKTRGPGNP